MSDSNKLKHSYQETVRYCQALYDPPPSISYNILDLNISEVKKENILKEIHVENEDTLDMAIRFYKEGYRPLVLNMASKFRPGGGVTNGRIAQEESLFRRTNAFMTHPPEWYPLDKYRVIYSPEVYIVKDIHQKFIDEHIPISMIAVAAIKDPVVVHEKLSPSDYELMTLKIESIFKIGLIHQHDSLILGALGCGVYNNPPVEILKIFRKAVVKYGKYFNKIGFAILSGSKKSENNLNIFRKGWNC